MTTTLRRVMGYGCVGLLTAPIWVPIAFVGYVGAKATRFAFRHATPVAFALGIGGVAAYAGCHYRAPIQHAASAFVERLAKNDELRTQQLPNAAIAPVPTNAAGLERIVTASPPIEPVTPAPRASPPRARATLPILDEPGVAYYFVKPGETLSRISERVTGDPDRFRAIARENRIADPDDVSAGTLLRIPASWCRAGVVGLYDRVPALNSLVLPGSATITEMFGPKAQEVIALNRSLGLAYEDVFPYPRGERVVWFP